MRNRTVDGPLLRDRRIAAGFQIVELARAARVSITMIKYAEVGERQLSDVYASRIARALGCAVEDFSHPKPDEAAA